MGENIVINWGELRNGDVIGVNGDMLEFIFFGSNFGEGWVSGRKGNERDIEGLGEGGNMRKELG